MVIRIARMGILKREICIFAFFAVLGFMVLWIHSSVRKSEVKESQLKLSSELVAKHSSSGQMTQLSREQKDNVLERVKKKRKREKEDSKPILMFLGTLGVCYAIYIPVRLILDSTRKKRERKRWGQGKIKRE